MNTVAWKLRFSILINVLQTPTSDFWKHKTFEVKVHGASPPQLICVRGILLIGKTVARRGGGNGN